MAKQMEQFEKWCDEIEYFCIDYTKRDSMRRGWKAALKWADTRIESAMVTSSVWDLPVQIRLDIGKELNGKS